MFHKLQLRNLLIIELLLYLTSKQFLHVIADSFSAMCSKIHMLLYISYFFCCSFSLYHLYKPSWEAFISSRNLIVSRSVLRGLCAETFATGAYILSSHVLVCSFPLIRSLKLLYFSFPESFADNIKNVRIRTLDFRYDFVHSLFRLFSAILALTFLFDTFIHFFR